MRKAFPLLSVAIYGLGASALKNGLALTPQLGWVCFVFHFNCTWYVMEPPSN